MIRGRTFKDKRLQITWANLAQPLQQRNEVS